MSENDPKAGWDAFIDGMRLAVDRMDAFTQDLDPIERADGFKVLTHTLGAQLEGVEMDRVRPEAIRHNTWQTKFLMDNPDGIYWTFEIDPACRYEMTGTLGEAAYSSISVYRAREKWHDTEMAASINGDDIKADAGGGFTLRLGGDRSEGENWLPLEPDTRTIWVRQFFDDVHNQQPSRIVLRNLDRSDPPPIVEPALLTERLSIAGKKMRSTLSAIRHAAEHELSRGNHVRVWEEMHGGAVFTSSDIWYQRGAWELEPDEALLLEGEAVDCRFWNIVLYSRFLNSLEHRFRPVSLTGRHAETDSDGRFRLVIANRDPGIGNWLDNEGRRQGMFALRWVCPERQPPLPEARVVKVASLS